jgi:hypothetical protein
MRLIGGINAAGLIGRIRGISGLALALVLVPVAFASGGCDQRSTDIGAARAFSDYRVYYAGPEVSGFELSDVVEENLHRDTGGVSRWLFFYGDCEPTGSEGGCPLPVEIQNYSICKRYPGMYPNPIVLRDFKGAKLARNAGGTVEIYTGTTAIAIFGPRNRSENAARLLRPVGGEEPAKALPPPARGALTGDFDCR